ncbi:putative metallo protease [Streptococcus infantarius subsp. infantarius]|nr:putative metallo protease [Streptococcus infantarius subsp. infantarius]
MINCSYSFFVNDAGPPEIYTLHIVGSVRCVKKTVIDETGQVSEEIKNQTLDLLQFAAEKTGKENKEIAVTFVTNERSHELNLEYRDTDRPTDVISLEYKPESDLTFSEEDLAENPELAEMLDEFDAYIGELFISVDKAREQAKEYGHSFEREMGFLVVHGFLHINGYDHYTPEEEKEMFTLQEEILTAYGLKRQ